MVRKFEIKVNKKTRAVEKVPKNGNGQDEIVLPSPEPVRLASNVAVQKPAAAEPMKIATTVADGLKIDLACGQVPKDGFVGADLMATNAKYKVNLLKFPWPWKDNEVDELHCSHFVEHIPMAYVEPSGKYTTVQESPKAKELFLSFFDECWRILKDGGKMTIITPCARNDRAFQDPTHRRFMVAASFLYLWKKWRVDNKLDHYNVDCDFDFTCDPSFWMQQQCCQHHLNSPTTARAPEVSTMEINHYWNVVVDWQITMTARKGR